MKKILSLAAIVLISASCIAQKSNVRKAENLALAETPDYAGARAAIKEALADEETKGQAKTWYIAGMIGYKQNEAEYLKLQMGKGGTDYNVRGTAVLESYTYWLEADKLAMTPVYDKKGKAKYDTGTRRKIADKMVEYYERRELVYYAYNLWEKQDFAKAYEAFNAYISIPDLEMMKEKRYQDRLPKDTTYQDICYNAALAAYNAQMYDVAIKDFRRLTQMNIKPVQSGQFIYQSYINAGDSTAANEWLDECINRFADNTWFMQNRINNLVNSGKMDEALVYLDKAIAKDPQTQYLLLKGSILDMQKRFDEAITVYEEALKSAPDNADLYYNYGVVYVDIANQLNEKAAYMNAKDYNLARVEITETFRKALPYFQKAYELAPDNYTYKHQLRSLYYRLGMQKEYDELAD